MKGNFARPKALTTKAPLNPSSLFLLLLVFLGTLGSALFFNKIANKLGFHDHPNGRSSHAQPTVTAMGIIVVIAFCLFLLFCKFCLPAGFVIGFLLLSIISFIDDLYFLKHSLRLVFQILACILMVLDLPFQSQGTEAFWLGLAAITFAIGVVNSYNFMDGINGMLTLHSLLVLFCLLYLDLTLTDAEGRKIQFANPQFIISAIIPMAIFAFYNVRRRALAFIGDVGSVSISLIVIFLMFNLLLTTGNYIYLLLFSTFGIDAGLTVFYKLILRENIFVPHRDFLFKRLVHVAKLPHLKVSVYYLLVQLGINAVVLALPSNEKLSIQLSILFVFIIAQIAAYIYFRNKLMRRKSKSIQSWQ